MAFALLGLKALWYLYERLSICAKMRTLLVKCEASENAGQQLQHAVGYNAQRQTMIMPP